MNWNKSCYVCALSLIFVCAGAILRAHPQPQSNPAPQVEVKIDNFSFSPATLTIAPATTVKWTNRDDIPHTVVSDDKTTFKSKLLDTDDSSSYTFSKPGTYDYFCSVHPKMTATVIVR